MKLERSIKITPACCLLRSQASLLVQKAMMFKSKITVSYGEYDLNAKSLLGMMLLKVSIGDSIKIYAEGEDAESALEALEKLL